MSRFWQNYGPAIEALLMVAAFVGIVGGVMGLAFSSILKDNELQRGCAKECHPYQFEVKDEECECASSPSELERTGE